MTKYKLFKVNREIYRNWWVFPLAVQIYLDDMVFADKNLAISVHFLCFHIRWLLFLEVEDGNDDR